MADLRALERIAMVLDATAEALGAEIKPAVLALMAEDLAAYPLAAVEQALTQCRRELTGRLTLAAVIERIERQDGRLTGDEAWALVIASRDEAVTVVWTDEIAEASGSAWPILQEGDRVGARMAFLRAYERITRERRDARLPPQVQVSLGHDRAGRVEAIERAVSAGLLTRERAQMYLPAPEPAPLAQEIAGLLTGNVVAHPRLPAARLAELRRAIDEAAQVRREREQAEQAVRREQAEAEAARKSELMQQAGIEGGAA